MTKDDFDAESVRALFGPDRELHFPRGGRLSLGTLWILVVASDDRDSTQNQPNLFVQVLQIASQQVRFFDRHEWRKNGDETSRVGLNRFLDLGTSNGQYIHPWVRKIQVAGAVRLRWLA